MTPQEEQYWNAIHKDQAERLESLSCLKDQEAKEAKIKAFCLEIAECMNEPIRRLIRELKEIA
jgi:hypothetical protein